MGYHGFNSFDQVVEHYNKTKPIQGARVSQDLRPIGTRRYWWNRIVKYDDNTYGLSDAYYGWYARNANNQEQQFIPILWERKPDGDFVTIRNHINDSCAVSRYQFLEQYLPRDMHFNYGGGNHWVEYKGQEFSLPKVRGIHDYNNQTFDITFDSKVTFKAIEGEFFRVSAPQPVKTRRLDKELTKKYRVIFKEYWEWASTILPVLGDISKVRGDYANQLGTSFWYWSKQTTPQQVRDIISNSEHEHRVALAVCMANEVGAYDSEDRYAEKPDTKEKLRKLLDRVAGLYATELK